MDKSVFVIESFPALGTLFWIEIFESDAYSVEVTLLETIKMRLCDEIRRFETSYSRFNDESTLSLLNRERVVLYDEDLSTMLTLAEKMSVVTGGVFDIFIKEKLEEKGYGMQGVDMEKNGEEKSFISSDEKSIILHGNKGVDLGGIGKGYLIDKLTRILRDEYSVPYFLINGGGDMYMTSKGGEDVTVYLEHPTHHDEYIGTVTLKNKSFCSSSSFKRVWKYQGKEVNHFIGEGEVWAASYVIGDTAGITDMFATVACILSAKKEELARIAKELLLEYMVITKNGDVYKSDGFMMEGV